MIAENLKLRRLVEVQAERIDQLEKVIEEVRRGGKRQAAPFSKGRPESVAEEVGAQVGH